MKIIILSLLFLTSLFGVDIALTSQPEENNETMLPIKNDVFGYNLFMGKFTNIRQYRYNPHYKINVGDNISIMFWGAYNTEIKLFVDNQGNLFIPKVGIVHVLGLEASKLNNAIKKAVKKVFKNNVEVYANVMNYQPVTVFVAGSVKKPGLYEGLSSDSVLQFLDKAKGVDLYDGSLRFISIKRDRKLLKNIDLYDFLIGGKLDTLQFKNGDVIFVDTIKHYIYVSGDVKREYRFELKKKQIDLQNFIQMVVPNKSATNVIVYHYEHDKLITKKLTLT
jgi:protein involved in polysaccharide export with SLBB domain